MTEIGQRWKLTVAYDGRPFRGWQSQPDGNSVQDHLESAVSKIIGAPRVVVHGAGRTDAGVHALGQVAHFDAPLGWRMTAQDWLRAINVLLPGTIRAMRCEPVEASFHARFCARKKSYFYKIYIGEVLPPLLHGLAWHLHNDLQENDMRQSLRAVVGTHDFRSFAANRSPGRPGAVSTVRAIHNATLSRPAENELILTFEGDGFLYKMVRLLVGTLVKIGQGRLDKNRLETLLAGQSGLKTSACAPADGLYLLEVSYGNCFHQRISALNPYEEEKNG